MTNLERDELKRLVDKLPEEQVPPALADVRRRLRPVRKEAWPPAFFGGAGGDGTAAGASAEERLHEGFGR